MSEKHDNREKIKRKKELGIILTDKAMLQDTCSYIEDFDEEREKEMTEV